MLATIRADKLGRGSIITYGAKIGSTVPYARRFPSPSLCVDSRDYVADKGEREFRFSN